MIWFHIYGISRKGKFKDKFRLPRALCTGERESLFGVIWKGVEIDNSKGCTQCEYNPCHYTVHLNMVKKYMEVFLRKNTSQEAFWEIIISERWFYDNIYSRFFSLDTEGHVWGKGRRQMPWAQAALTPPPTTTWDLWEFLSLTWSHLRLVANNSNSPPVHSCKTNNDVLSIIGHDLKKFSLINNLQGKIYSWARNDKNKIKLYNRITELDSCYPTASSLRKQAEGHLLPAGEENPCAHC